MFFSGLSPRVALADAPSAEGPQGGARTIDLGHGATLDLPEAYQFLEHEPAAKLLAKHGSSTNENLLGLVTGAGELNWLVVLR